MTSSEFRAGALKGKSPSWTSTEYLIIAGLAILALALRAYHLSADGFADDEIHKWLAGNRYLQGDFGGDDVEHPMIMKGLIAIAIALLPKSFAPETLTRIPNVIAGAVTVWAVAQLGKRLFGKTAGLVSAAIYSVCAMAVGYARLAKEDTLYTLFMVLFFWCIAEAKAAADDERVTEQRRWEMGAAASIGLMFASKYQIFILPVVPPLYFWLRAGDSKWRLSFGRVVALMAFGLAVTLAFDWTSMMPSTWRYMTAYLSGNVNAGDRATSESIIFMGKLWGNLGAHLDGATPWWFFVLFAAVKLAVPTLVLSALGLGIALVQRQPAHRMLLLWLGMFTLIYYFMAVKYGRYFIPMFPALALLAGEAVVKLTQLMRSISPALATPVLTVLALFVIVPEAAATVSYLPHPRFFINALGGGEARLDYYFPHCDYSDTGLREATLAVAAQAEPGSEITAEPSWVVRYYADSVGRKDITTTTIRENVACSHDRTCYVMVQPGRWYWHNEAALKRLALRKPWTTIDIGGHEAVRVYRLEPTDSLFPPQPIPAAGAPTPPTSHASLDLPHREDTTLTASLR